MTFSFKGGREANGDPLYVARAKVDGVDSIGKVTGHTWKVHIMKTKQVNTRHKWCHLPYGGKEHQVKRYEVLVHAPPPSSTRGESSSGVSGWGLLGLAAGAVAVGAAAAVVSSLNNDDTSSDSDDADPIAVDKEDADLAEAIRQSLLLHRPPSTSAASTPSQDSDSSPQF